MSKYHKPTRGPENRKGMMDFGAYVYELRSTRDMTQRELGALIGTTNNHISDIENGVRKLAPEHYRKFAAIFELDRVEFGKRILKHYDSLIYDLMFGS